MQDVGPPALLILFIVAASVAAAHLIDLTVPPDPSIAGDLMSSVYLPPSVRGPLYAVYGILGVIAGAMAVAFATLEAAQPSWFKVALAVYVFLGGAVGATAASNTPSTPAPVVPAPVAAPVVPPAAVPLG